MSKLLVGTGSVDLNEYSLVEWSTNPVAERLLGESDFLTGLDVNPTNGLLYGASDLLYLVNPIDGSYETIGTIRSATEDFILPSIAFSPSGVLYASDYDIDLDSYRLYTIDTNTAFATEVGIVPENALGIDFAPNGTLYGATFDLITIDPSSGNILSNIGTLEGSPFISDLDIASDGTIYGVDYDDDIETEKSTGLLFEINPFSASTTLIGSYPSKAWSIASIPDDSFQSVQRFWNGGSLSHIFTANQMDVDNLTGQPNLFQYEGNEFDVPINEGDPVFRYVNISTGSHFLSFENGIDVALSQFINTGAAFNAYKPVGTTEIRPADAPANAIPIFRLTNLDAEQRNPLNITHFYTSDENNKQLVLNTLNYRDESVAFWALPAITDGLV